MLYIELNFGRTDTLHSEPIDHGPIIELEEFQITYGQPMAPGGLKMPMLDDCVVYDGMFYSDIYISTVDPDPYKKRERLTEVPQLEVKKYTRSFGNIVWGDDTLIDVDYLANSIGWGTVSGGYFMTSHGRRYALKTPPVALRTISPI